LIFIDVPWKLTNSSQAVIPLYAGWLAYTTFTGARQGFAGLAGTDGDSAADVTGSKRQQKLEKRGGQRVTYR